jgi:hypothetical protein
LKNGKVKGEKELSTLLLGAAIAPALREFPTSLYDPTKCTVDVWQAAPNAWCLLLWLEFFDKCCVCSVVWSDPTSAANPGLCR